ncbi:MAG: D-aminoacylase [Armatimonadetes bacterium]|nr:D-aminoacylase [Armatimonadota bacterium]
MGLELILHGGEVIDGSGAPGFRADVGVCGDRIVVVGDLTDAWAPARVDCAGLTICPGFIDLHSHSDLTLLANPRAESKVHMGVTSECNGQCGMGVFPVRRDDAPQLRACCSFIEADVDYTWSSARDYLERLRQAGPAVNVAQMVGQSALRAWAMGFADGPASPAQIAAMCDAATEAFGQGVAGISLGLAYALGSFASREEIVALCATAARHGRHVSVHLRHEGAKLLEALDEIIGVAREVEREGTLRLQIDHLKCAGESNWGRMAQALERIELARAGGCDIAFDVYPYIAGSRHLSGSLPAWMHAGGNEAMVARLRSPQDRARLRQEYEAWLSGQGGDSPFELPFANILVTDVATEANAWTIGQRLDAIAAQRRQDPLEATMDLLAEENGHVSVCLFSMSEEDMQLALAHPLGCVATDGLAFAPYGPLSRSRPHPRSYGTYPRVLGRYVRELGLLSLPEAIRKCTDLPASRLALRHRGLVREGFAADLVVFDPSTIADQATFESPHQYPVGIKLVVVNGQITVQDDRHTGASAGRLLASEP